MTLVLALRCREGAVLACDSQVTSRTLHGRVHEVARHTKLALQEGVVWGWAGSPDAAQRFAMNASEHTSFNTSATRSALQDAAGDCTRQMLAQIQGSVDLEVLLAAWNPSAGKALILNVHIVGDVVRSVWVDDLANVSMIGSPLARTLGQHALRTMGFANFQDVGLDEATTLAHKLIADVAANPDADDVGEPVHVGAVTAHSAARLDAADIDGARDSAGRFTSGIRRLVSAEALPADTTTSDVGLDPPERDLSDEPQPDSSKPAGRH